MSASSSALAARDEACPTAVPLVPLVPLLRPLPLAASFPALTSISTSSRPHPRPSASCLRHRQLCRASRASRTEQVTLAARTVGCVPVDWPARHVPHVTRLPAHCQPPFLGCPPITSLLLGLACTCASSSASTRAPASASVPDPPANVTVACMRCGPPGMPSALMGCRNGQLDCRRPPTTLTYRFLRRPAYTLSERCDVYPPCTRYWRRQCARPRHGCGEHRDTKCMRRLRAHDDLTTANDGPLACHLQYTTHSTAVVDSLTDR
jgi:hypothetical protein